MSRYSLRRVLQHILPQGINDTESKFLMCILENKAKYEAKKFRLCECEDHVYTPDFLYHIDGLTADINIEVKGCYALPSQGRARLAFCLSVDRYGGVGNIFVWAKKNKGSDGWQVEVFANGNRKKKMHILGRGAFNNLIRETYGAGKGKEKVRSRKAK